MEHKEIKLKKQKIYSKQSGVNYVEMLIPENWSINIYPNRDNYGGSDYPYTFRIRLQSEDKTVAINYFSPRNYLDDHTRSFSDYQIDDYGNLLNSFTTIEDYLKDWADKDLKDNEKVTYAGVIETAGMDKIEADRKAQKEKDYAGSEFNLNWYYYRKLIKAYSYFYNNKERICLYAGIIEADDFSKWSYIPMSGTYMMDPFMKNMMLSMYPNAQYDKQSGSYIYTMINETKWTARQLLTMDCSLEDYEYAYKNILAPIRKQGIVICDDIWNDFAKLKKENSRKNEQIRAEKKETARIKADADRQRRESNKQLYDSIRKTQQETHDILKSSYENQQKSQAKVREMWGDVNQGNTRFVDRDGNEHVVHTYNNYAYKRGDTYVTSDSPLDHPYDWEELEKKKY